MLLETEIQSERWDNALYCMVATLNYVSSSITTNTDPSPLDLIITSQAMCDDWTDIRLKALFTVVYTVFRFFFMIFLLIREQ